MWANFRQLLKMDRNNNNPFNGSVYRTTRVSRYQKKTFTRSLPIFCKHYSISLINSSFATVSAPYLLNTQAASSGQRNVTVWRPVVCPSVCPVFFNLDRARATHTYRDLCDVAGIHFGPTISKTDINLFSYWVWSLFFHNLRPGFSGLSLGITSCTSSCMHFHAIVVIISSNFSTYCRIYTNWI